MAEQKKQLLIVTGMSGAGKTVAIKALEDMGYFVVDNLPPELLGSFWELINNSSDFSKAAVVVDLRVKSFYKDLVDEIKSLEDSQNVQSTVLFLDASDDVLVSRYKETRRLPPLAHTGRLLDGIQEERNILSRTKNISNIIIDTSHLSTKELKTKLVDKFGDNRTRTFSIEVMSFGFKYGIPIDADIVMDVRFLPNPFYIPQLKPFTGLDRRVFDYVMSKKETKEFYAKFLDMLETAIPGYIAEGKEKLTIAIGCTGGQHRSVSIARQLAVDLAKNILLIFLTERLVVILDNKGAEMAYGENKIVRVIRGRRPKIVVIGGGTGLPVILNALKEQNADITAIVTVADDGGSSGAIRDYINVVPPGDIRNVLVSLSDLPQEEKDIFQYRFNSSDSFFAGHAIGNLIIAALDEMQGNIFDAVQSLSRMMRIDGRIFPASNEPLTLNAEFVDGTTESGETEITSKDKRIKRVWVTDTDSDEEPKAVLPVLAAIMQADAVVLGPGSLFTSILPNLMISNLGDAVRQTKAEVIYICNIMTQQGETDHFTAAEHVQVINDHLGGHYINTALVNGAKIDMTKFNPADYDAYLEPVRNDFAGLRAQDCRVITADFIDQHSGLVFHDGKK